MSEPRSERTRVYSYSWMAADALLFKPTTYDEVAGCLTHARKNDLQVCPKGSGLSFGDVALLSDHVILDISELDQILSFDSTLQIIRVQSGIRIIEILKYLVPYNLTLTGLTGSKGNTVAGNISNDVNGKDAWKHGSFCNNVVSMKIMLSDLRIMEVSRALQPELFHSICGGLGLIAIILEVSLRTVHVPSYVVELKSTRSANLKTSIDLLEHASNKADFTYCWIDPFARSASEGRGICEYASYRNESQASDVSTVQEQFNQKRPLGFIDPGLFWKSMQTFYTTDVHRIAGMVKYHLGSRIPEKHLSYSNFQYPMLRWFSDWNLFFYPHGFREAQLLFEPEKFSDAFKEILGFCRKERIIPWICAIKKHRAEEGLLSFGGDGYSFTLNYSLKGRSAKEIRFLEESIMGLTIRHSGKCYLGKYPFVTPSDVAAMYPRFSEYAAIKTKWDPERLLWSNAAERLMPNL